MTVQLDILTLISEGEKLRDLGIKRAVDKAGTIWTDEVYELFKQWLSSKPTGFLFMTETFRMHVERNQMAEIPGSRRAWGFLSKRAVREKLIRYAGTQRTTDPGSHRTPATRWEKI